MRSVGESVNEATGRWNRRPQRALTDLGRVERRVHLHRTREPEEDCHRAEDLDGEGPKL